MNYTSRILYWQEKGDQRDTLLYEHRGQLRVRIISLNSLLMPVAGLPLGYGLVCDCKRQPDAHTHPDFHIYVIENPFNITGYSYITALNSFFPLSYLTKCKNMKALVRRFIFKKTFKILLVLIVALLALFVWSLQMLVA